MRKRFLAAMAAAMIGMSAMPVLASGEEVETTESAEETGSEADRISEIEKLIQEFEEKIAELKAELKELRGNKETEEGDVLYQDERVIITYNGVDQGLAGPKFYYTVQNLGSVSCTVQLDETSLNDFMVDTIASLDIAPGKKAKEDVTILGDDLPELDELEKIETKFVIFDDGFENRIETDYVTIFVKAD